MLYKNLLSKSCHTLSVLTLSGILLGSTFSWAMEDDDRTPLNQRPIPGVVIDEVLPDEILVPHIINNSVLNGNDRKNFSLVSRKFFSLSCDQNLPAKTMEILNKESLEWLHSRTESLSQSRLWMYGTNITMNQIPYSFKKILPTFPHLTSLIIQGFSIKHWRVQDLTEAISHCKTLTTLHLSPTEFGFDGSIQVCGDSGVAVFAPAIATHPSLKTVELRCRISKIGAKDIATALSQNHTLTRLDLKYNNIGVEGAIALAAALSKNHTLKTLDLACNCIGNEGLVALLRRNDGDNPIIHLKVLNLRNNLFSWPSHIMEKIQAEYQEDGIEVIFN